MRRGTIVLTPFPFTDLSDQKVRPAMVVSRSDRPGNDVILAFISSVTGAPRQTDLHLDASHPQFTITGLKRASVVKLDKLVTLEASILLGELGELPEALVRAANQKLRHALDL